MSSFSPLRDKTGWSTSRKASPSAARFPKNEAAGTSRLLTLAALCTTIPGSEDFFQLQTAQGVKLNKVGTLLSTKATSRKDQEVERDRITTAPGTIPSASSSTSRWCSTSPAPVQLERNDQQQHDINERLLPKRRVDHDVSEHHQPWFYCFTPNQGTYDMQAMHDEVEALKRQSLVEEQQAEADNVARQIDHGVQLDHQEPGSTSADDLDHGDLLDVQRQQQQTSLDLREVQPLRAPRAPTCSDFLAEQHTLVSLALLSATSSACGESQAENGRSNGRGPREAGLRTRGQDAALPAVSSWFTPNNMMNKNGEQAYDKNMQAMHEEVERLKRQTRLEAEADLAQLLYQGTTSTSSASPRHQMELAEAQQREGEE
ncbi:unnamed protein product [Amoebophrya sp. A120]|nr:unnamed protein product [Amoebophrya sp. A120]|eukprot:GSA120T00016332001.1